MPRYFTKKIEADELVQKIWSTLEENDPVMAKDIKENMESTGMSLREIIEDGCINNWHLTPSMEKDLDKVSFDYENVESGPSNPLYYEDYGMNELMGFKTLDNGLTFLGIQAGGDWEHPIFFIVYSDGSQLRAYIPEKGNIFNTDTKQAFGNDEEADAKNLLKRGVIDQKAVDEIIEGEMSAAPYDLLHFDVKKLKEDVLGRIVYKEGKGPKKKHTKTSVESLTDTKVDIPPKDETKQYYLIELVNIRNYDHNFLQLVESDDATNISDKVRNIYKGAIKEDITRVENYLSWTGDVDKFIERNIFPNKQGFDFPGNNAVDLLDKMMDVPPISSIRYVSITPEQAKSFESLAVNKKLRFGPFVYDASKKRVYGAMLMHVLLEIGYGNSKEIFDKLKNINHIFDETGDLEDFMYQFEE